jgi:hypothetical protein
MFRDEDDNYIRPALAAFQRRQDHDSLSVTWWEYFDGEGESQLRCAIEALRNSLDVRPKGCFCVADVQSLLAVVADHGGKARAVFLPEDNNPAHAGIYGISPEESQLLEKLAIETWSRFLTKTMADDLQLQDCCSSSGNTQAAV